MGKVGRCQNGGLVRLKKYPVGSGESGRFAMGPHRKKGQTRFLIFLRADFGMAEGGKN
jgi:hypothetical protein